MKNILLRTGAALFLLIALGHIACLPFLDRVFEPFGMQGFYSQLCDVSAAMPYVVTIVVALCFALAGLYGLSASADIRRLPLTTLAMRIMVTLFAFRFLLGLYELLCIGFSVAEVCCLVALMVLIACYAPGCKGRL